MLATPFRARLAAIAVLSLAVLAIYAQNAGFDFVHWDDPNYITDNYRVLSGLTWSGAWWALTTTHFSNWHPLTWLSHMAAWSAFGPWAGGHHLVNVALHLANTLLCFFFLKAATGAPWRALLVALLFAVHPLHVETVSWLSDRKALLAALFWWLTLHAWLAYVQRGTARAYRLALICYVLALMAKPMAVSLPIVLFAVDIWPLRRLLAAPGQPEPWWPRLREKLPFIVLAMASAAMTYYAQDLGGAVVSPDSLPLTDRLTNAFVVYQTYLQNLLWPSGLAFFYSYPGTWPVWRVVLAMSLFAGLLYAALSERQRRPWWLAGWLWFTVMLLPVIGIVQVGSQSYADRYMYLTSVGFFVALVWSLPDLSGTGRRLRPVAIAGVALVLALLGAAAQRQAAHWRDSETLYQSALRLDPDNHVAHLLLSERLVEKTSPADLDAAERHAILAIRISDSLPVHAYGNRVLGRVALARGRHEEARRHLRRTLDIMPRSPKGSYYMAQVELADGRWAEGELWLLRALQLRRDFPDALEALAEQKAMRGDLAAAIRYQQEAVLLRPWLLGARLTLAGLHESAGDRFNAIRLYREVLERVPGEPAASKALLRLEPRPGT